MSTSKAIYDKLFDGKTITVRCATFGEYESLRTSLCKHNNVYVALDMTSDSIIARYDKETQKATFKLAVSDRFKMRDWEIVEESGESSDGNAS